MCFFISIFGRLCEYDAKKPMKRRVPECATNKKIILYSVNSISQPVKEKFKICSKSVLNFRCQTGVFVMLSKFFEHSLIFEDTLSDCYNMLSKFPMLRLYLFLNCSGSARFSFFYGLC